MFEKRRDNTSDGPKAHFDAGLNDLSANRTAAPASGRSAVIGPKIRINGDITGEENLIVEGRVQGSIQLAEHSVDVGQTGQVHADITAKVVKVDGEVRGDITGHEKVTISRTGNVQGNIVAPRMTLEDGAKFKGSIDMDPGEPAAKTAAKPAAKAAPAKPAAPAPTNGNGNGKIPAKTKEAGLELKGE